MDDEGGRKEGKSVKAGRKGGAASIVRKKHVLR